MGVNGLSGEYLGWEKSFHPDLKSIKVELGVAKI